MSRDLTILVYITIFLLGQILCMGALRSLEWVLLFLFFEEGGKILQDSPEHSLWRKELPRVTITGRSSIRWRCTTLELASGPAKALSWATSYRSPIPMGNTVTPRVSRGTRKGRCQPAVVRWAQNGLA